ncbi:glycosyltransferase [Bacillus mycoides]|uniref:glycosyltransferase n=1 Tax=Bacillus mycoides TaxID=1405 RepID=UPI00131A332B|nr:glycosyltransferase [Bacillus mycoides]
MKKGLYIILTDFDEKNTNSGPTVRSLAILEELKKLNNVDVIYGQNSKERFDRFRSLCSKNVAYDYCYIESKVGVTRFFDTYMLMLLKIKLKNTKIGFYYRDMYWKYGIQVSKGKIKNKFVPLVNKMYLKFIDIVTDVVYCQSVSFGDSLKQEIKRSEIELLPPGCEAITPVNILNNEVIYVGEIDLHFSGIDLLIDSLELVNKNHKVKLNIVCRKKEYEESEYLKEANQKYEWLNVSHHNKQTIEEVYNKSAIAIIPRSGNEYTKLCLPIKLYEYITFEKPIVAVNHGETGRFIQEYKVGVACTEKKDDIANSILSLLMEETCFIEAKNRVKMCKEENLWSQRAKKIITSLTL